MHGFITNLLGDLPLAVLLGIIAAMLYTLAKGADLLVEESVALSLRMGVSKVVIGATIVSLGTTTPEVAVSVMAAIGGNPDLALGNAVGSIICDTGLILGLAIVIGNVPVDKKLIKRQGSMQLLSVALLIAACVPYSSLGAAFKTGGSMPQAAGFLFLLLLGGYLWLSVKWGRQSKETDRVESHEEGSYPVVLLKILLALTVVILSSEVLIPSVEIVALRLNIPHSVIAATLVALGTSLPELVTAVTAVRKGHGGLALGNVLGADVLNALFVAGLSAAVTRQGLRAEPHFFSLLFPTMLGIVLLFILFASLGREKMPKAAGFALLAIYFAYLLLNFW